MEVKTRYQKIIEKLINESFPKLKGKVKIHEVSSKIFFWVGAFTLRGLSKGHILITTKIRKLSDKELKGLLAHELCHVEDELKMGFFKFLLAIIPYLFLWTFGKKALGDIERKTDMKAIRKGYGKEVYAHTLRWEKSLSKKEIKEIRSIGYMSSEEIKKYAKDIKKW